VDFQSKNIDKLWFYDLVTDHLMKLEASIAPLMKEQTSLLVLFVHRHELHNFFCRSLQNKRFRAQRLFIDHCDEVIKHLQAVSRYRKHCLDVQGDGKFSQLFAMLANHSIYTQKLIQCHPSPRYGLRPLLPVAG
jgi:hypothetical protein